MTWWEVHPALVHFPIAFLLGGLAVDLYARRKHREALARAATGLYVAGTLSGLLAALAGLVAFFTVPHAGGLAHALMYWHPGVSLVSLGLFTALALRRWRSRTAPAGPGTLILSLFASALLAAGGLIGGYMVYHLGVGVTPEGPESPTPASHEPHSPAAPAPQEPPAK